MLTPYIAQVLLKASLYSAVFVYAVIGLLASTNAWFLPVETLGKQLSESGHQATKGRHQFLNEDENDQDQNTENIQDSDIPSERHI